MKKPPAFLTRRLKALRKPKEAITRFAGDTGHLGIRSHHIVTLEARARSSTGQETVIGARVRDQSPLDRHFLRQELAKDPDLNYVLFQSGERLRRDFYYSGLQLHTLSTFEPRTGTSHEPVANLKQDALDAYRNAMQAVSRTLRPILVHVCCTEGTAQDWAVRNGQSKEAGITVFRLALEELAIFYGLLKANA